MATMHIQTDVCVLGGAGAGLSAAIHAKESGAEKVLLIDKMKQFGGCTRMCGGMFMMGTSAQKKNDCDVDIDEMYRNHMTVANWNCDAKLVRRWFTELPTVAAWLEQHNVELTEPAAFSGNKRTYVRFRGGGNLLINTLVAECEKLGVELRLNTRATKLITDASGAVTGVVATCGEDVLLIEAKSVVIATGSVAYNDKLVDELYPRKNYSKIKKMSGVPHNTGDGYIMAQEVGAMRGDMNILFIGPQLHGVNVQVGNLTRRPMLIEIDSNGERFADESLPLTSDFGWMRAVSQDRLKDHRCYCLMDESILRRMVDNPVNLTAYEAGQGQAKTKDILDRYGKDVTRFIDTTSTEWIKHLEENFPDIVEKGKMAICNSLDEVAEWIGCDPARLKATVEEYNGYCANGYDNDYLKPAEYLWPLTKAPYYIFEGDQGIDTCIGGIAVDHNLRVLDNDHNFIPNLYAAGVCTSGWTNSYYSYFGACLSLSVCSGYAAGLEAAKNCK